LGDPAKLDKSILDLSTRPFASLACLGQGPGQALKADFSDEKSGISEDLSLLFPFRNL
jgi:hypothetical protein